MSEQVELVGTLRRPTQVRKRAFGLLMTATLSPPAEAVARFDRGQRLLDYLSALEFYLALPCEVVDRIVFVDNSNGDLQPLIERTRAVRHDKLVELISFAGNDHPPALGKAYGEFKLIDHALSTTTLFTEDERFWKVTGRLRLVNLVGLSTVTRAFDLMCDLHNMPLIGSGRLLGNRYMDLRAFAIQKRAYDALFRGAWTGNPSGLDAAWFFERVVRAPPELRVIPRFPRQPWFEGISGRHQRSYLSSRQLLKDGIRNVVRRLAPGVWL